jgi:hydroxymethylpyrimidine/phosphomethylpyrimidine kinase
MIYAEFPLGFFYCYMEVLPYMKTVLTIAGSDCSGGAGIQADIKTITAHGLYAMSAITALTAQNTTGVYGISEVSADFLTNQLDCVFTDIFPNAVKIGMVSDKPLISAIAQALKQYKAENVVLDPVMVSTSGSRLMAEDASDCLIRELMPLADIITPNLMEAEVLSGVAIDDKTDAVRAADIIADSFDGAVLIKGGHSIGGSDDLLYINGNAVWIEGERIENPNTHGTGCTLSSAIASNLALGVPMEDAVRAAKEYITGAIAAQLDLGKGRGPLNHIYKYIK